MPAKPAELDSTANRYGPLGEALQRAADAIHRRTEHLSPTVRGLMWAACSGLVFSFLNSTMRHLTLSVEAFQAQFLRYIFGLIVLLPMVWHHGLAAYRPRQVGEDSSFKGPFSVTMG